ncbi:hypothetical protein [Pseudoroseicyclus sp. CXY001]|uniref:hypothetical protein n=1 Tax=Pseudoroseicyclus sp. CXY001 TaxID=3242492 RepID=UPI00358DCC00
MKVLLSGLVVTCLAGAASAEMSAQLMGAWTGGPIPEGQHCALQGGDGATPPIQITGIPEGTAFIVASFSDTTYAPMADGGHGTIMFPVRGDSAELPAVPGMTATDLPGGAVIAAPARGSGDYASPGYLPPCSGGNGNRYAVDLTAIDASTNELEKITDFTIGTY